MLTSCMATRQFGCHQLMDGRDNQPREQQAAARAALLEALERAER
jgi:hypothetical protein